MHPGHVVAKLARKHGVDAQAHTFTPWSHIAALLHAQRRLRARELCAAVIADEIALFDRAHVDFGRLCELDERRMFWVTRAKDNMRCRCVPMRRAARSRASRASHRLWR